MFYFPFLDELVGLLRADLVLDEVLLFLVAGFFVVLAGFAGLSAEFGLAPVLFLPDSDFFDLDGFLPAVFLIFLPSTPSSKKSILRSSKLTDATLTSTGSPKR
jgi:hypothetical protein